jgi:hypothetical protein
MNNIFPGHCLGEIIGGLLIEHMNGEERALMSQVSKGWKVLSGRSTKITMDSAKKIVDFYLDFYRQMLKESFVQAIQIDDLSNRFVIWGSEMKTKLYEHFLGFSQKDLEHYIIPPEKAIIEKGQAVLKKNIIDITHIGAEILFDIAFLEGDRTTYEWQPHSAAEWVAFQEITEYADSLIYGTMQRIDTAFFSYHGMYIGYLKILNKLSQQDVMVGLQSRMMTVLSEKLVNDYELNLTEEELYSLYRLRSQKVYRSILNEIKRPLQLKAVVWIAINHQ